MEECIFWQEGGEMFLGETRGEQSFMRMGNAIEGDIE